MPTAAESTLAGRRVLVVEDEYFLADDIRRILIQERAHVLGPVPTLAHGLSAVRAEAQIDCAVLDIALGGDDVFAICAGWLLIGMAAISQSGDQDRGAQGQFVGAWHLAWLEQPGADGKLHRIDCCGMLVYTPDGHMSVQVMERNPLSQAAAGPQQYSQGGYEASYGTYAVDARAHTFTFHVEGALVRSLIGKDLPRAYALSGKLLVVKSTRPDEHWRVTWERYAK